MRLQRQRGAFRVCAREKIGSGGRHLSAGLLQAEPPKLTTGSPEKHPGPRRIGRFSLVHSQVRKGFAAGRVPPALLLLSARLDGRAGCCNEREESDPPFQFLVNDPSAGSPTETLLRLLLPLNDQV